MDSLLLSTVQDTIMKRIVQTQVLTFQKKILQCDNLFFFFLQAQPPLTYGRDQRSSGSQHQAGSIYRNPSGRPPSDSGGRSRPTNFESLPLRLQRKYEDEQKMQPHYYQSVPPAWSATASKVDSEWDGGSVPFVGSSSSNRDEASQQLCSGNGTGQPYQVPSSQEQEEMNHYHIRPRSQESSMTGMGLFSQRKTSSNDSSSSR